MSMQDPVADMLVRIRSGHKESKKVIFMPSSKFKENIAGLLKSEGFIKDYKVQYSKKPILFLFLKYFKNKPVIEIIRRVSRPGLRVYKKSCMLPQVMGGLGVAVISTSQGIMTNRKAFKLCLGGEVVLYIT
ncbi:MAG: 30S ribosomal subunit protein S8 [Candidatus Westeberhardia cardiocondylae]|nr:30S ribosomal subunit protein S8 [Candidatus Westeberhardia cardiocondylae]